MTPIEDQLRAYAEAITAGERPLPERREPTTHASRGHRWAFAAAAAVLVVIITAGTFVGLRAHNDPSLTASATSGDLTSELTISNSKPATTDVVKATLKVTNRGTDSVEVLPPCSMFIVVQTDTGPPAAYDSGSTELDSFLLTEMAAGFFAEPAMAVRPVFTYDQVAAAMTGDTSTLDDSCSRTDRITLDPGQTVTTTKQIALGALGLQPGPGTVKSELFGGNGAPNASIAITIPPPRTEPVNRDQAIRAALADPTVVQIVRRLPATVPDPATTPGTVVQSGTNGGGAINQPNGDSTSDIQGISSVWPIEGGGWQVAWIMPEGGFLATVTGDGTVTVDGRRPATP